MASPNVIHSRPKSLSLWSLSLMLVLEILGRGECVKVYGNPPLLVCGKIWMVLVLSMPSIYF